MSQAYTRGLDGSVGCFEGGMISPSRRFRMSQDATERTHPRLMLNELLLPSVNLPTARPDVVLSSCSEMVEEFELGSEVSLAVAARRL